MHPSAVSVPERLPSLACAAGLALVSAAPDTIAIPIELRSESVRYEAVRSENGDWATGDRLGSRTDVRDSEGRLIRWTSEADGERVIWIGVYEPGEPHPRRAAYWLDDRLRPEIEHFVLSPDGRVADVLYASPGEKPRRQMRVYLDDAGRELYPQYFAPRSQTFYSEELYAYDERGNERGRTWRRLDGRASRATHFETLDADEHGRWLRRLVTIDGVPEAIDVRTISDGPDRPVPPAAEGPVERDERIYPIPFAPGVISTNASSENTLSFGPDGNTAVFSRYDDWRSQTPMISFRTNGVWREPEPLAFTDTVYNAALSDTGDAIVYCVREEEGGRVFITLAVQPRPADEPPAWTTPEDLTASAGIRGSYFDLEADGTLLFHLGGDLFTSGISDRRPAEVRKLPSPINTPDGVEFAPSLDGDRLLFTRSVEGDDERSGVFVSRRSPRGWSEPVRLPIPYGWGARITHDGEDLVYTVDDGIARVPVVLLPMLGD